MKLKLNFLYYISFILVFFPMFVFYVVSGTNGNIQIALIALIILYLIGILKNFNAFQKFLNELIKLPIMKYYLFFVGFVALTTIVHIILGTYTAPVSFYVVRIYKIVFAATLIYFLPVLGLYMKIKQKSVIKIFYSFLWVYLIICIIQYFVYLLDIGFLENIFYFFTNARIAAYLDYTDIQSNYRINGFFEEPSTLGQFIFITMPLIFNISTTKYKLYKNKYLNFIVKKTFIPLMLAVIIFTKSPIYLVFCFSEFFVLLFLHNLEFIKKHFTTILVSVTTFLLILVIAFISYASQLKQTYIYRIVNTVYSMGDFNKLVILEPSLATRITAYVMQIVAFTKNIFFGCGLYNVEIFVNPFYLKEMPLPITHENYFSCYLIKPFVTSLARGVVYSALSEFGLIGFSLYVLFVYKNLKFLNKMKKYFYGIQKVCLDSSFQMIITISVISFYNLYYTSYIMWIVYGFVVMFIYELYKNGFNNREETNGQ